jgi:hypothetical protein
MSGLSRIVGYQVVDSHGNHWADRASFLILSEQTAINDLSAARNGQGFWTMVAILDGDIQEPQFETGCGTPSIPSQVLELVSAAIPLSELLFDHHEKGKVFTLEVDGGEVTRLKLALAPFASLSKN